MHRPEPATKPAAGLVRSSTRSARRHPVLLGLVHRFRGSTWSAGSLAADLGLPQAAVHPSSARRRETLALMEGLRLGSVSAEVAVDVDMQREWQPREIAALRSIRVTSRINRGGWHTRAGDIERQIPGGYLSADRPITTNPEIKEEVSELQAA